MASFKTFIAISSSISHRNMPPKRKAAPAEEKPVASVPAKTTKKAVPAPAPEEPVAPAKLTKTTKKTPPAPAVVEEPVKTTKRKVVASATKKSVVKQTMKDEDESNEEELLELLKEVNKEEKAAKTNKSVISKPVVSATSTTITPAQMKKEMELLKSRIGEEKYNQIISRGELSSKPSMSAEDRAELVKKQKILSAKHEKYVAHRAKPHPKGGVCYLGHLPRGLTETAATNFFKQFGTVKRIMLSKCKKTGAPKGFGFIEFSSPETAMIVADAMDGYMLFGKTLQCQYVPYEQLHPTTFRNAYREFKQVDVQKQFNQKIHNKNKNITAETLVKKSTNNIKKLLKLHKTLASQGIDYSIGDVVYHGSDKFDFGNTDAVLTSSKKARYSEALKEIQPVQLPKISKKVPAPALASVPSEKMVTKSAAPAPVVEKTVTKKRKAAPPTVEEAPKVTVKQTKSIQSAVVEEAPAPKAVTKKTVTKKVIKK